MTQGTVYDPDAYQRGRGLSSETIRQWMNQLGKYVSPPELNCVLDLGCGTGRFTAPLARFYPGAFVIGVEPSFEMLEVATRDNAHPRLSYVQGLGESIPIHDSACDVVFMSMVLHHLNDQAATARELGRITNENAYLFIRSAFRDRLDGIPLYDYFPSAKRIDNDRLPALETTIELLADRFTFLSVDVLHQVLAGDLHEYADRLSLRQISTLKLISDSDFQEGLARIRRAAAKAGSQPVVEAPDLLVLRRF